MVHIPFPCIQCPVAKRGASAIAGEDSDELELEPENDIAYSFAALNEVQVAGLSRFDELNPGVRPASQVDIVRRWEKNRPPLISYNKNVNSSHFLRRVP